MANGGSAITGYCVTPFIGGVAQTPWVFASTVTPPAITGLTNGTSYTFRCRDQHRRHRPDSASSAAVTPRVPSTTSRSCWTP